MDENSARLICVYWEGLRGSEDSSEEEASGPGLRATLPFARWRRLLVSGVCINKILRDK
jgi:hypothetical protein